MANMLDTDRKLGLISCVNSNYLELSFKAALADYATAIFKTVWLWGSVRPSGGTRQYYYFSSFQECKLIVVIYLRLL